MLTVVPAVAPLETKTESVNFQKTKGATVLRDQYIFVHSRLTYVKWAQMYQECQCRIYKNGMEMYGCVVLFIPQKFTVVFIHVVKTRSKARLNFKKFESHKNSFVCVKIGLTRSRNTTHEIF